MKVVVSAAALTHARGSTYSAYCGEIYQYVKSDWHTRQLIERDGE